MIIESMEGAIMIAFNLLISAICFIISMGYIRQATVARKSSLILIGSGFLLVGGYFFIIVIGQLTIDNPIK